MSVNKQTEANKKWQEKNKERAKYLSDRSRARSFIKNLATLEDLEEFKTLIEEREKTLYNQNKDQRSNNEKAGQTTERKR